MIQKLKMQDKNLKIITFGLFSVTLYFNPSLADPFNTPKMIILLFISIWAISNVVFQIKFLQENIVLKLTYIMGTCLILSLTISAILSQNKLASIVGENYRKNGLLTYIALVLFFLLTIPHFTLITSPISIFFPFQSTQIESFDSLARHIQKN